MGWLSAVIERRTLKAWAIIAVVGAMATVLLVGMQVAFAGPVGNASGFEDDDGNLNVNTLSNTDWNSFNTLPGSRTWTGTAPTRQATGSANGWTFKGIEDWQATTADSGFAGGTKQDNNCASVISAKAPNKDDLKRIYLASKTVSVGGEPHVFLDLAWVRIPQNTTSPSAHIGFEFNKGTTACGAGSTGLVQRTAGDMLIVYDFEGGSGDAPVLTLRRWVTSGACEISSNSPPCWGTATNLTAGGFAEGKVNTAASALDTVAPSNDTLNRNEFGEAGIDLTAAGVFQPNTCENFGSAYAVSRSSGNSGTAQMKDLAGPTPFELKNCGTVKIIKQTSPRGVNQDFDFTSNIAGGQLSCSADMTPANFKLNDNGNAGKTPGNAAPAQNSSGNTETCSNVPAGNYTVTEGANPTGFDFTDLSCTSTGTGTSATPSSGSATRTANITMAGGGSVTCVYTNTQQRGNIVIDKETDPSGDPQSFDFTLTGGPSGLDQEFSLTDEADPHDSGSVLSGSGYNAAETVPDGWDLTSATCDDGSPVTNIDVGPDETVTCTFKNTKRGKILIDKVTNPSGDLQEFAFTLKDGPSGLNQSFKLADQTTPHSSGAVKPGSGYNAAETVPDDWELTSATCNDSNSTVTNINVSPGETVTCTFNNLKRTTSISTKQSFTPQDTATITGTGSGTFNGKVDFELYKGENCDTGTLVYFERNIDLPSSGTVKTTNGAAAGTDHDDSYTIEEGTAGEYHWKVSYHDDSNHPDATSCVEESTVTIDDDNTQS